MDDLSFLLLVLVTWTDEIGRDIWHWLLSNVNLIAIIGAFRAWSMHEHRRTAEKLDQTRAALAVQIATVTEATAAQVHAENEQLAVAIAENTTISQQAFREANQVNTKIANIGAEQVLLATQQNTMQQERDDEDRKE